MDLTGTSNCPNSLHLVTSFPNLWIQHYLDNMRHGHGHVPVDWLSQISSGKVMKMKNAHPLILWITLAEHTETLPHWRCHHSNYRIQQIHGVNNNAQLTSMLVFTMFWTAAWTVFTGFVDCCSDVGWITRRIAASADFGSSDDSCDRWTAGGSSAVPPWLLIAHILHLVHKNYNYIILWAAFSSCA